MDKELNSIISFMRPAFSRKKTYLWFVICVLGLISRQDTFGVTSIIRALNLEPLHYASLVHFFHSSAWNAESFMKLWWNNIFSRESGVRVNGRIVLTGDHTKIPKDGRKMPGVATLHQDSETGSKPSYFRGHNWGCIGMVIHSGTIFRSIPLWATIQDGVDRILKGRKISKSVQIVKMAKEVAESVEEKAYLVLDAYFSVGPVFNEAAIGSSPTSQSIHILTRAKKNVTTYHSPKNKKKKTKGRNKKYGEKVKLISLFQSKAKRYKFKTIEAKIYNKKEKVQYLVLDMLWKPTKIKMRYILIKSSRGQIILMTSDMNLNAKDAIEMYCMRVTIETVFDVLKNTLGGLGYHFWSKYLNRNSRTPKKNTKSMQASSNLEATKNTLEAIEKFVNLQLVVVGLLQLISKKHSKEVGSMAACWLRTVSVCSAPSEFITKVALSNLINPKLSVLPKNWITVIIDKKARKGDLENVYDKAG
jgi:hypothetical protein